MKANFTRWSIMSEEAKKTYQEAYGDNGKELVDVLETAPYEITVVSQLFAYLQSITEKNKGDE